MATVLWFPTQDTGDSLVPEAIARCRWCGAPLRWLEDIRLCPKAEAFLGIHDPEPLPSRETL